MKKLPSVEEFAAWFRLRFSLYVEGANIQDASSIGKPFSAYVLGIREVKYQYWRGQFDRALGHHEYDWLPDREIWVWKAEEPNCPTRTIEMQLFARRGFDLSISVWSQGWYPELPGDGGSIASK